MIYIAISLFLLSILGFLFTRTSFILIIISLELIILSIGLLFINLSFQFDDLIGYLITLYLLPIAGAESSIALAYLVAYYPLRGNISLNG